MNNRRLQKLSAAFVLLLLTISVYVPVYTADFVTYDDPGYVTSNSWVQQGMSTENVKWAFTTLHFANWHPLTWLSHMMDVELFGLRPGLHHVTSVLLHALNTVLVFLILERFTGSLWRAALVAALFGLHPMQVESVAWISERKNVLSMFFGLISIWFYGRFAVRGSRIGYASAVLFFALSLMAKPMLVTLPCVLLLLDFWPFSRFRSGAWNTAKLVFEKAPFFVLSGVSCVITVIAQANSGAVLSLIDIPFSIRAANAVQSYVNYLTQFFWPTRLVVFYPHPVNVTEALPVALSALTLVVISAICIWKLRKHPHWAVGWFWYLGTFVPMIGLVQVGIQSMADRYIYFPVLGLAILLVWSIPESISRPTRLRPIAAACAGILVVAMSILTWRQAETWKNPKTLFMHAVETVPSNVAYQNMADIYLNEGNPERAEEYFRRAIAGVPREYTLLDSYVVKHSVGLAVALNAQGRTQEAERQLTTVIQQFPQAWRAYKELGRLWMNEGRPDKAIAPLEKALELQPDDHMILNLLGNVYMDTGHLNNAVPALKQAIKRDPFNANYRINLGIALSQAERYEEAEEALLEAIRLSPNNVEAYYNYGFSLSFQDRLEESKAIFLKGLSIDPEHEAMLFQLSRIESLSGRYDESKRYLQRLLEINPQHMIAKELLVQVEALLEPDSERDFSGQR